jgi:hypothetical protein
VKRIAHRAVAVDDPHWCALLNECAPAMGGPPVRLLRSRDRIHADDVRDVVACDLLPAIADTWTEDRRRAILSRARARRPPRLPDADAGRGGQRSTWMHPGVPWIARRLRIERELACDDACICLAPGLATMPATSWSSPTASAPAARRPSSSAWRARGNSKDGCWR